MFNETICGPICQHPACWSACHRQTRGIKKPQPKNKHRQLGGSVNVADSDDDSLPTQNIFNILDDYGPDPRDRYPTDTHRSSSRKQTNSGSLLSQVPYVNRRTGTTAPFTTPATLSGVIQKHTTPANTPKERKLPTFNKVEVQELFDLDDLQKDWQETFFASRYYVWAQNNTRPPRKEKVENKGVSVDQLRQGPVPLPAKDVTEEMVPVELEREREQEQQYPFAWPKGKKWLARRRSPSPRRPKSRGSQDRYVNILDLPEDILLAILDSLDRRGELTTEKVQEALLQVIPAFSRQQTALSLASGSILKQEKMKLIEGENRNIRHPEKYQTRPSYQLDEGDSENDDYHEVLSVISSNREIRSLSDYPAGFNKKKSLPSITGESPTPASKKQMTSISLGLPEIPTGYKYTRPFTYCKGQRFDFGLAPVTHTPHSDRRTITWESDIESTLHVTIPTESSEREDPELIQIPGLSMGEPLHAISPADSTNVPKTPVATPATRQGPSSKESALMTSPLDGRPPLPPPASPVSMETGLGPIREISFDILPDGSKDSLGGVSLQAQGQQKSRGGRTVHFAPGVMVPSAVKASDNQNIQTHSKQARNASGLAGTAQMYEAVPTPVSIGTSLVVTGAKFTSGLSLDESTGITPVSMKESSEGSSPEPWPQVNEEEYMKAPSPDPSKSGTGSVTVVTPDSKFVNVDDHSVNTVITMRSDQPPLTHPDISKKFLQDGTDYSPAPPPPSPEMKQASTPDTPSGTLQERKSAKPENGTSLPVVEEEHITEGGVTDRTEISSPQQRGSMFSTYANKVPEGVAELASMATDTISNLMNTIGDNFQTQEDFMAQVVRSASKSQKSMQDPLKNDKNKAEEITEDGGDHDGFKQDLEKELDKIDDRVVDAGDKPENDDQTGIDGNDDKGGGGFGGWSWVR